MNNLEELIRRALMISNDNVERSRAEQEVFKLLHQNPGELYYNCAKLVGDETKDPSVRKTTATVIKQLLAQKVSRW